MIRAVVLPETHSGAKRDETALPELPWSMLGLLATPSLRKQAKPKQCFLASC